MTVAIGWLLVGVYGALPILFLALTAGLTTGWLSTPVMTPTLDVFQSPVNALFEGVSGVTGTGLTMTITEDALPRSLQWWRSLMQWVGGVGVVVFAVAIAFTGGDEAFQALYKNFSPVTSLQSDTRETVKLVWWIFCLLTFVACVAFWLAGMPMWHAVNHAKTGLDRGFAVTNEGIAAYNSRTGRLRTTHPSETTPYRLSWLERP